MGHNVYLPKPAKILEIKEEVGGVRPIKTFRTSFVDGAAFSYRCGQCAMLSVFGKGEVMISISSSPLDKDYLQFSILKTGRVTTALHEMEAGDIIGIRGPYGNGFPVEEMAGHDLLIVAGGLGMAPLRSLLWYALDNREQFGAITLMYGARQPAEMLFREELSSLADVDALTTLLTVDRDPTGTWKHQIGLLPELFKLVRLDASRTYAAVVGPPVVYKFVLRELLQQNFSKDRILMSLERRMKCGVGKCGHCTVGYKYTCIDGPVFTYWDAINLPEVV